MSSEAELRRCDRGWGRDCYEPEAVAAVFTGDWRSILTHIGVALRQLRCIQQFNGRASGFWDRVAVEKELRHCARFRGTDLNRVCAVLRVAVTGKQHGLGIFDIIEILGMESLGSRIVFAACEFPEDGPFLAK